MLLFIFNMYETTFSFLGCILKFRFLNLYIIIVTKIKRGFLSKKERVIVGWIRKSVVQIFSKEVFWLLLPWMCSLLDVVYETLHFFKLSEVVTSFMNNWWDFDVLGEIFISPKPFIVWSRTTPHFNQKTTYVQLFYFSTSFREPEVA